MTVEKEYKEGAISFLSADVEYYSAEKGQPTTDLPVFYNPRMVVNRDFSVLFLAAYLQENDVELICEPLAGCGVRTLRYLKECTGDFHALMFDANPQAVEMAQKNIIQLNLEERALVNIGDAKLLLLTESREKRFDFIDIDPFGTPVPYVNASIQALNPKKGLLAITATDMPVLCGVYPEIAYRKYGGFSIHAPFCHEIAVRLVIGQVYHIAGMNDRAIEPLAVLSTDHYVRVWLAIRSNRDEANKQVEQIGMIRYCKGCMHSETLTLADFSNDLVFRHRKTRCDGSAAIAGPLWTGDLYNMNFLDAAAGIPGLETTVPLMLTEVFEKRLSWVEYLRCCCSAPARIMGLSDKGVLGKGYDADIIAVEKGVWKIHETEFHSKAKYSPFDGRQVLARTVMTIVGGEIVYKDGNFLVGSGTAGRVPVRKSI